MEVETPSTTPVQEEKEALYNETSTAQQISTNITDKDSICDIFLKDRNSVEHQIDNNLENDRSVNSEDIEKTGDDKNSDQETDDVENIIKFTQKKRLTIVDSDSEGEKGDIELDKSISETVEQTVGPLINSETKKRKLKRLAIVDSDSDIEEAEITPHNKSFTDDNVERKEEIIYTTNSKGELVAENSTDETTASIQKSRLSALCDSDSEEELPPEPSNLDVVEEIKPSKRKKPQKSKEEQPKKMTGSDAAKLRMEIKSESQRMVREKNISLPYHRPKSYTLKEFLARRPKLSETVPQGVKIHPPSIAIKMSTEQLAIVSQKLKEREEKLKEFYKSESESEKDDDDENDKDYIPPDENAQSDKETEPTENVLSAENKTENFTANESSVSVENSMEINTLEECLEKNNVSIIEGSQDMFKEHTEENSHGQMDQMDDDSIIESSKDSNIEKRIENVDTSNKNLSPLRSEEIAPSANLEEMEVSVEKVDVIDKELFSVTTDNDDLEKTKENDINAINTSNENEPYSMDYDFNLDDMENSERLVQDKETNPNGKSDFNFDDLDREIENFGVRNNEVSATKKTKLELIKEKLANVTPRLSGCPDNVIDLDTGITKPNEITKLMERFVKHTSQTHSHKNKVKLSIVSVESGEIHKETVAMSVEDESPAIEEKPGAKLQKLRYELQTQIAQKRSELWQKKAAEGKDEEKNYFEGEKEDCGAEDILDDEEEEVELSESSEEDDEDEEIEETEKEKVKSAFIDEEAEDTDEEDEEISKDNGDKGEEEIVEDEEEEDDKESDSGTVEEQPTKRVLKRIVVAEDSDDEDDFDLSSKIITTKQQVTENMDSGISQDDDDFITPHQPQSSQTPLKKTVQTQGKPDFEFLTPISYITGLQNLNNSASKTRESPGALLRPTNEPSPLKENNWQHSLQKKLFTDTEITDSQLEELTTSNFPDTQTSDSANEELLANMCSGQFPSTIDPKSSEISSETKSQTNLMASEELPSTQDLLNVCSGGFTGITSNESTQNGLQKNVEKHRFGGVNEIKSLDEDHGMIISQLLDEEEMENFRRKFDSPLLTNTQRRIVEEFEEVVGSGRVIDSDDEDDEIEVKKKKNQRKLVFSDDEDSNDVRDKDEEEVIDLHDDVEEDDDIEEDAVSNIDNIDYDSEENEIAFTEDSEAPKRPTKALDFFENEAELSESDWDSADEDEKDLDKMELEQGDAEKFDEKKIRNDLEKIHMRRLLDDDTREVKMLQEMLLEDGELHGTGRKRQFRWKNIDSIEDDSDEKKEEDDVYIDEDESEEQWRRRRYEREMFFKEKLSKSRSVDEGLLSESQLLKIGQKVMQRSQVLSQGGTPVESPKTDPGSPVAKQPFSLLNKRGSFLKRSDETLQKLAEYNKTTTVILGAAKNSKAFLFQTTTEETSVTVTKDKKRKASDGTPNVIKKLRLSSNFSPAGSRKKGDKPDQSARAKLFGNW